MRIGIDVRYLSHGLVGGVHTYVAHFVPALIDLATDHQIYLYADTKCLFELSALPGHVTLRLLPYHMGLSSLYHDLFMWRQLEQDQLDVIHFPANYGFGPARTKTVITLHDAINILPLREILRGHPKNPHTMIVMTYLHYASRYAVARASLMLTVSEHAKCEIARHSSFDPKKIVPVPHAPTSDFRRIEDAGVLASVRQQFALTQPFVLADALKNPAVLVRAWRRLPEILRAGRRLLFFSRRPDPLPVVHEAVAAGEAKLLIRPSRAELIALYSMAEAFVFPSWIEGFGLPVLEAMTCGAPVIASDRGSIPEVAGGAALIVDAEDDATLAGHLERVLSDPAEARRLRQLGFARAAQFSWRNTAQKILESYQRAVRES